MGSQYADLIGTVARSHGISLRSTFDYIRDNYDIRDYQHIHIIFLMVLIRIADFLQIQSARAPIFFTEIHKIKSPFSANEWRVHRSISNITRTSFDPEAIQINASPPDIQAFLRLDQWFRELQTELDTSWAVLGEIYGRFENVGLPNLKIDIRRIRSNLEGHKSLSQNLPYVPRRTDLDGIFSMSQPTVVVTDNNGAMPLNLARTGFSTYDTELIDALRTSIMEEYVGDAFLESAESPMQMIEAVEPPERLVSSGSWNKFVYNTNG
jgi:hypothetical protein